MKIALISQEYPPETANGGISTQTYMRAHGLSALGHEVFVISHSLDNVRHKYLDKSVNVTRIPGFDHRLQIGTEPVRWLSYSMEVAVAVRELHLLEALDLVVFPEWGGEGYIHLLNQTSWNHIPTLVHIHGPMVMFSHTMNWPEMDSDFYRVATMMESTCLRLADALSASNTCSADWCVKYYGIDNTKIPILYTGIDTNLFYPRPIDKAVKPTVIFVGSIRRNKGVDLLVKACCILAKDFPDLRLKIVGNGDPALLDELGHHAISAGFPDLLDFPGYVGRDLLPDHLSAAYFFAGPSIYEGGPGNVYLEAMACGIPVIACSGSGVDGIVTSFENGLLIPPNDLDALTSAISLLLVDSTLRKTLGEKARAYVLREADSNTCMKKLEHYYQLVSERSTIRN